jgi:PAS domain-containing protein
MALYNVFLVNSRQVMVRTHVPLVTALAADTLVVSAFLHFSGDVENPFRFAYLFPVAAAAVTTSLRAGLFVAGCALFSYGAMAALTWVSALPIGLDHHHLALFDPALHNVIDPDVSPEGGNYLLIQLLRLGAIVIGSAIGFGVVGKKLRTNQNELKLQYERMRLLMNVIPEGVAILSKDGTILFANYTAREFMNAWGVKNVLDIAIPAEPKERFEKFQGLLEEFETKDGKLVLNNIMARQSSEGPVVWVLRDVTAQRSSSA